MLCGTRSGTGNLIGNMSSALLKEASVFQADTRFSFPNRGDGSTLYVASEENAVYRWDTVNNKYFCVGRDYTEITIINGGNA